MKQDLQLKQGFVLAVLYCIVSISVWQFAGETAASYIGLMIGVSGFAISVQQLYIYSLVGTVVTIERRNFYRASSLALLVIGLAIICLCVARILVYNHEQEPIPNINSHILVWSHLGAIFCLASPTLLWALLFAFTTQQGARPTLGQSSGAVHSSSDDATATTQGVSFSEFFGAVLLTDYFSSRNPGLLLVSKPLWILQLINLVVTLSGIGLVIWGGVTQLSSSSLAGSELAVDGANIVFGFHSGTEHEWLLEVVASLWAWLTLGSAIVFALAFVLRIAVLEARSTPVPGRAFMLGFASLFVAPIALHVCTLYLMETGVSTIWSALMVTAGIFAVFFLCLGPLDRSQAFGWFGKVSWWLSMHAYRWLFQQGEELVAQLQENRLQLQKVYHAAQSGQKAQSIATAVGYSLVLIAIFILTVLQIPQSSWLADNPVGLYSFSFLVLACAGMTAIDLRDASNAFNSFTTNLLNSDLRTALTHEIVNNINAADTLVASRSLQRLLAPAQQPAKGDEKTADPLEQDKTRVKSLIEAANLGIATIRNMVDNLRARQDLVSDVTETSDLSQFTQDVAGEFKRTSELPPNCRIEIGNGAKILAHFNRQALYHILRIILNNALKATDPQRDNRIQLRVMRVSDDAARVAIAVSDTGVGMTQQVADRFGQKQTSTTGGYGVGLTIASSLARTMSCQIDLVNTAVGQGSEIRITVPSEADRQQHGPKTRSRK